MPPPRGNSTPTATGQALSMGATCAPVPLFFCLGPVQNRCSCSANSVVFAGHEFLSKGLNLLYLFTQRRVCSGRQTRNTLLLARPEGPFRPPAASAQMAVLL